MFAAASIVAHGSKVLPYWLILTYLLHTFGELCLSPVGLSYVTKLAPQRSNNSIIRAKSIRDRLSLSTL